MKQVVNFKLNAEVAPIFISKEHEMKNAVNMDIERSICAVSSEFDEDSGSHIDNTCKTQVLIQVPWQRELRKVGISIELSCLLVCQLCTPKCVLSSGNHAAQHMYRVHGVPKQKIFIPEPWNTPDAYFNPTNNPIVPVPGKFLF